MLRLTTATHTTDGEAGLGDEGTMSFLDHLDELRKRLIRSALFIGAAFVICWFFSDKIYNFLQVPVRAAMLEAKREYAPEISGNALALSDLPDGTDVVFPLPTEAKLGNVLIAAGNTVPARVKRGADGTIQLITSSYWLISDRTVVEKDTVIPPKLYEAATSVVGRDNQLVVGTVQGAFNLYIKVAFYAAIFFAVPFRAPLIFCWALLPEATSDRW